MNERSLCDAQVDDVKKVGEIIQFVRNKKENIWFPEEWGSKQI